MTTKADTTEAITTALAHLNSLREESRMSAEDQEAISQARDILTDLLA